MYSTSYPIKVVPRKLSSFRPYYIKDDGSFFIAWETIKFFELWISIVRDIKLQRLALDRTGCASAVGATERRDFRLPLGSNHK